MKSALTATIALAMAVAGAEHADAEEIVNTTFLSSFTADVSPRNNQPNAFDIQFQGVFLVPATPAGAPDISSLRLEYDFGITSWSQNVAGNIYGGNLSGGAGWGLESGVGWIDKYSTFNPTDGPTWQVAISNKNASRSFDSELLAASGPYAQDGYVPYYFKLDVSLAATNGAPVQTDPSYLIYVGGLRLLSVVDTGSPDTGSGNGNVAAGSSSGLVWSLTHIGSGGDAIPTSLRSNLPAYLPNAISAVPEPAPLVLMSAGLLVLSLRRHTKTRRTALNGQDASAV